MTAPSLPALLRTRAADRPDAPAFTFVDYALDPNGFSQTLTWSQLLQRSLNLADDLRQSGAVGDRAAILAPQGLDYIVAFYGALEAGLVAVPLPVPLLGAHDERVTAALRDCTPSVILTTSDTVDAISGYARADGGNQAPAIIEVDSLDLDVPADVPPSTHSPDSVAHLQYTSGSTGQPTGAMITHRNLLTNFDQIADAFFEDRGRVPPADMNIVGWIPFYHDMGLMLGIALPLAWQCPAWLTNPVAFLQRPARWLHQLAEYPNTFSAAPNFAFDLAARRTSDEDMAGLDLGRVMSINNGSERVSARTIARFTERFAPFNLPAAAVRPSYGLAEATLYVAAQKAGEAPHSVWFVAEQLSEGKAVRCDAGAPDATELVAYHLTGTQQVRVVDPDTCTELPDGQVGELWVQGDNVGPGYWNNRERTESTFHGYLASPRPGTAEGPWLRSGDLTVISEGDLFIIGRIKDLLVVNGRNHYPDDIESTIQEITRGRVAAVSVPGDDTEQLVTIVEVKSKPDDADPAETLRAIKRELSAAVSQHHGLRIYDLVLVPPGAIPVTTSGKIRRSSCAERYQQGAFERLDA
ncbi:MAG: AMP-binding protein [Mycobacterium sp.]